MGADREVDRTLRLVGGDASRGEAPWNPIARAAEVWEADLVPLPTGFHDDPDAAPAIVMVGAAEFILQGDVVSSRPVDAQGRARVIAEAVLAAGRQVGVLPPTLHVRDEMLARILSPELEPRGTTVRAAPMPELDEAIRSSLAHLAGDGPAAFMCTIGTWRETEASPEELADFHTAAAAFYRAESWRHVGAEEALVLSIGGEGEFLGVVMGQGGMEYGLALYSEPEDLSDLYEHADDPMEGVRRMRGYTLNTSFERRSRLPRHMLREVAAAGWEIADPHAHPVLYGLRLPGFRVTAQHVRIMSAALAGVVFAVSGDDMPREVREIMDRSEVRVDVVADDDEDELPWAALEEAHVIGPAGPNADPEAVLARLWSAGEEAYEELRGAELERVDRFAAWLRERGFSKAAQRRHLRNAGAWSEYLAAMSVPAQSATEFDLRSYLYDWFPRKESLPKDAERTLDDSLRTFFRWLKAEEGIGCPWAAAVLDECARVSDERGPVPGGGFWEPAVREWRGLLWEDLDERLFLHDRELPGTEDGWPTMMNADVARLSNELQRRWLIWYDEAVRGGVTDLAELCRTLTLRQRGWENTPHPEMGGRTPQQVVAAFEQQAEKPQLSLADFAG